MSTPVYYLKISVKILGRMTVCKPQRREALMWTVEYLRSPSLHRFSRPIPFLSFIRPPSSKGQGGIRWQMREGNGTRGTAQDGGGGGGGVGRKRKKAMYSAFVLIIPPRLGDIQAASVPRLGFGGRVISGSAGERLQRSSVSHVLRRRADGGGVEVVGGRSLAPMYGRSGRLPPHAMSGNEETVSLDVN